MDPNMKQVSIIKVTKLTISQYDNVLNIVIIILKN